VPTVAVTSMYRAAAISKSASVHPQNSQAVDFVHRLGLSIVADNDLRSFR
jgi:hypothetical protein